MKYRVPSSPTPPRTKMLFDAHLHQLSPQRHALGAETNNALVELAAQQTSKPLSKQCGKPSKDAAKHLEE